MLDFWTTYRLEWPTGEIDASALLGGHPTDKGQWEFWKCHSDPYDAPLKTLPIRKLIPEGSGAFAVEMPAYGEMVVLRLVPLTPDFVRSRPDLYPMEEAFREKLDVPGNLAIYFQQDLPDGYADMYGPKSRTEETAAVSAPVSDTLPVGAVELREGKFYQKQSDGTWTPLEWFP